MFGFRKKKSTEINDGKGGYMNVPEPKRSDYALSDDEKYAFDRLSSDSEGYIRLADLTHAILHQQPQYISAHMDKSREGMTPFLMDGLRFTLDDKSYHAYMVHKDDALEFMARVRAWRNRE